MRLSADFLSWSWSRRICSAPPGFASYITVPAVRSVFTVLYCNFSLALGLWAVYTVAGVNVLEMLPDIPVVVLILIVEAVFFLMDVLFEAANNFYQKRVRRFLLR